MLYEFALFFHLLGAIVFFAVIVLAGVAFSAARKRERPSEVALLLGLSRVGVALVAVGSVLVVGFGLWLVDLGDHSFGDAWIAAALLLFVAAIVLGALGGPHAEGGARSRGSARA